MAVDFLATFQARYPTGTTQIYVDQATGSDSNPGTTTQPKATIQAGLTAVGTTGKVWVRNGNYVMVDGFIPAKNGGASTWVHVAAVPGQTPRIVSPGDYQSLGLNGCSYIAFYGIEIAGVSNASQPNSMGIICNNSHHVAFWKCNVHDATYGFHSELSHHIDICYNKFGPNLARWRFYGFAVELKSMVTGGNDADGYSSRIIGNVIHDSYEDPSTGSYQGDAIGFTDTSGRGGAGGSATTDKYLVGFNLMVNNGRAGINSYESDNIYAFFNTMAHNVRSAGVGTIGTTIGEVSIDGTSTNSVLRWNAITTRAGRATAAWLNGVVPTNDNNVISRGTTPALTGQRDQTALNDAIYKSANDAMTNIDGWRAASTLETVQLNTATGGTVARDALAAWPDYFGELRPTASGNTWTLGWMEPTAPTVGAPIANFTATPNPANIGQSISFADTSTGTPTSWLWNFGDGTTSSLQNVVKSYSTAGTYTVSLTVTNAGGSNAKTLQVVISAPQSTNPYEAENALLGGGVEPPQVLATNTGYSGTGYVGFFGRTGNFVQFSISGLSAGQYALQLRWGRADAGTASRLIRVNGTAIATLSIPQTATDWSDPARFVLSAAQIVTLTASTNLIRVEYAGADLQYIDLDRISITPVTGPTVVPVTNFSFSPNNPTPGSLVSFTDASTQSPTTWSWNFGDGATSNAQNPTHAFTNPGVYTVSLTSTNVIGSNTRTNVVTVTGAISGQPTATDSITVTGNPLQNNVDYTAHVEVRDSNGLIGTDVEDFTTSWAAPAAPVFTVVA